MPRNNARPGSSRRSSRRSPRSARQAIALAALSLASACAGAQEFPTRPVRVIVPSTPGGSIDTFGRLIGTRLTERWGQQVVVDNRPGAGGAIGGEVVAKANPDGHTLFLSSIAALASNVSIAARLPYDPVKDFAPVIQVASQQLVLLVTPGLPAKSVAELTALARARPGALTFASAGNGAGGHLSGELYRMLAKIDIVHVPYKGVAPAIVDVISGQVNMTFASIASGAPQARSGKLRALAVTGEKRSAALPDLPTMHEAGIAGYQSSTWYGVVAPRATPAPIVQRLNRDFAAVLGLADIRDKIAGEGAEPVGGSADEFGRFIVAEIGKWAKVLKAAGMTPR